MKPIKSILRLIAVICITPFLSGCGDDEPTPLNEEDFAQYNFALDLSNYGADQADIILTTIQYTDYIGNKVTDTFGKEDGTHRKVESQPFAKIPATGTVTVTENVRSGLSYDKDSYQLGLAMKLTVTTQSRQGRVISKITTECQNGATIKTLNLNRAYPRSTTFVYSVEKDGRVSIRQK